MFNSSEGSNNRYFLHGSSSQDSWISSGESWQFKLAVIIAVAVFSLIIRQF